MRKLLFGLAISTALTAPALADPAFQFVGPITVNENAGTLSAKWVKTGRNGKSSKISYGTAAGTAKSGIDYTARSGGFTVKDTTLSGTVTVPILDNLKLDGDRVFYLRMYARTNAQLVGDGVTPVTIKDNEVAPPTPTPTPAPTPTPTPTPAPSTHRAKVIASEGDSQSQSWGQTSAAGNWTDVYRTTRKPLGLVEHCALAVGGSTIDQPGATGNNLNNPDRLAKIDACNPSVVVFSPTGSNDLVSWNPAFTADSWLSNLWSWADPLIKKGYKVAIGTPLPQGPKANTAVPTWSTDFETRRQVIKEKLRVQAPQHGATLIDFTGSSIDDPNAYANPVLIRSTDELHLTDCNGPDGTGGQCVAFRVAAPILDQLLGISGAVVVPPPAPPPAPAPAATPMGAELIPSNFDLKLAVKEGGGIPVLQPAGEEVGAFRFICSAGQLLFDDPLVYPGQPGASHLHQFYGNTSANANSNFASLRQNGDSTCNQTGLGVAANRSAYWMPAMLDGKGNAIQPDYVQTYYKRVPDGSPGCLQATGDPAKCITIPNGLRFIFGYDMVNNRSTTYPGHFICDGPGALPGNFATIPEAKASCPVGSYLVALIDTPKCWNGKDLDSADHRSHLSDMVRNDSTNWLAKCPTTHPFLIPQFTLGVYYAVVQGDDLNQWRLSSDEMHPELPHGATFHADYWEAWDVAVKLRWEVGCINKRLNCSAGELGDGGALLGAAAGTNHRVIPARVVAISSIPRT